MPMRNLNELAPSEIFYVRRAGTNMCYRVFSPEQLSELIEAGRISEDDHVGLMKTKEGLSQNRDKENEKAARAQARLEDERKLRGRVIDTTEDDGVEIGEYL